jgi:hypothetical protein
MTLLCSDLRYCVYVCLEKLRKSTNAFGQDILFTVRNLKPDFFENEPRLLANLECYSLKGYSNLCQKFKYFSLSWLMWCCFPAFCACISVDL